jgi:hypothetical protein
MVTESIIPPAPAAHNTIAFINPNATDQNACLPAYLPTTTFWNSGSQFHSRIISKQQNLEN